MELAGIKAQPRGSELISDFRRIFAERLLGERNGLVPVLADLRGTALGKQLVALTGARLRAWQPALWPAIHTRPLSLTDEKSACYLWHDDIVAGCGAGGTCFIIKLSDV